MIQGRQRFLSPFCKGCRACVDCMCLMTHQLMRCLHIPVLVDPFASMRYLLVPQDPFDHAPSTHVRRPHLRIRWRHMSELIYTCPVYRPEDLFPLTRRPICACDFFFFFFFFFARSCKDSFLPETPIAPVLSGYARLSIYTCGVCTCPKTTVFLHIR